MKRPAISVFRPLGLAMSLIAAIFVLVGCSIIDPPTASNDVTESSGDLWNPQPGDEIVPGRQIPIIMDESYWETPGLTINPSLRGLVGGLIGATPIPIDGALGGTVTCGNHRFEVPAGAVTGVVNFTMVIASNSGIAVDCGPSPLIFADGHPVRLSLSYAGTQYDPDYCERVGIEPLDPSPLQIWYMATDGTMILQSAERQWNASAKTISVNVDHFSRYIIA